MRTIDFIPYKVEIALMGLFSGSIYVLTLFLLRASPVKEFSFPIAATTTITVTLIASYFRERYRRKNNIGKHRDMMSVEPNSDTE